MSMLETVRDDAADRRAANRAMAVSAAGLAITAVVELALAMVTGSVALLGDALHNLSDVSTSAVVFAGFWISRRPPTARYPYGYERAEDLSGLGVALVIWLSALFAGYESVRKLLDAAPTSHPAVGMAGAAVGIVGNQLVARYKLKVGRRIRSATLIADAKHSWLDAISSVGALIGLALVIAGYRWGDPIAGFAVTLFICHVGVEVTREMVHRLMDGVDPDDLDAAKAAAARVPGVRSAEVRGRWMGRTLALEVETGLGDGLNLADADRINASVEESVRAAVPAAGLVHAHAHSTAETA
ncbi:cation diffusion facilitator family transporter [Actinoallomurus sp. NBC_01490]|uniref:cation diffusion facilitator family transporter n=1 Tax=Actinoallomurus sp. NBC_01490 TaxID=2903557 RepID=UPI002E337E2F|nr:cation diffusion facilitator family transporter [Actinoallomurus sp. NBC_01490]